MFVLVNKSVLAAINATMRDWIYTSSWKDFRSKSAAVILETFDPLNWTWSNLVPRTKDFRSKSAAVILETFDPLNWT